MSPTIPFLLLLSVLAVRAHSSTFGFDIHHRFSDKLRDWARSTSTEFADWPEEGTPEYYSALVAHDRALLHRRGLAEGTPDLTFADGNETLQIPAFGSLYYAEVSLGTPNVTFLVALDTGSHLTWVPCDCKKCVSTSTSPPIFLKLKNTGLFVYLNEESRVTYSTSFNIFNSRASSTSKRVPCSSSFCTDRSSCVLPTDTCPYVVRYLDNAMSSGVLLEDVLHLITDDGRETPVQARVTFGCGQDQANTPLPTGILGLSRKSISIPSTLAAGGLTANSFSMCFGEDRSGRIRFGDKGSPDQRTTPFNLSLAIYVVTVTDVQIGGDSLAAGFDAFFDTGSTLTLLKDPIYSVFTAKFDSLMQRQRITASSNIPIEFCYEIGPTETQISIPLVSLKMKGGEELKLHGPVILVRDRNSRQPVGICLAVIKSSQVNIIGQNFMTGYKIVFDRERGVIGWNETDCYKEQSFQAPAPASARAPVPVKVSPSHSPDASPQLQEVRPFSSGNGLSAAPLLRPPVILGSVLSQLLLILSTTF